MSADWESWERIESGPAHATRSVLLLPGGMCTAMQYEELMAEPMLADVRLVAVTLPGHGGRPPLDDDSVENYALLASGLAEDLNSDVVVGFSYGATVALEMVGSGAFSGPAILLGPSFSRKDEAAFLRAVDRLARVLGHLPYSAMVKMIDQAMKGSPLPPERLAALVGEMRRQDPRVMRRAIHVYLRYLGRYGSVVPRLCEADVPAWVVHSEKGDGGVTDDERRILEACSHITVMTLPGTSFLLPNEQPALVAQLVRDALAAAARRPTSLGDPTRAGGDDRGAPRARGTSL